MKKPSSGDPSPLAGRLDTNTRKRPSGDIAGSMSFQRPEKDAVRGADQWPPSRCDSRIVERVASLRENQTLRPSGANAGAAS